MSGVVPDPEGPGRRPVWSENRSEGFERPSPHSQVEGGPQNAKKEPSGGKHLGEGNRQPRKKGRLDPVLMPEFQGGRIVSVDKTENLDGFLLRIDNPVLVNPEPFVKGMLYPAVHDGGPFG